MIKREIVIINKLGLHARAAAKLASTAGKFASSLRAGRSQDNLVDAKSVMSLMLLAASQDTTLYFQFDGRDESEAALAVQQLIADRFGEEQ